MKVEFSVKGPSIVSESTITALTPSKTVFSLFAKISFSKEENTNESKNPETNAVIVTEITAL